MKHYFISAALAALLLNFSLPSAAETPPAKPAKTSNKTDPNAKKPSTAKSEAMLVDINSASVDQLKKLPRIGDAEAIKIVTSRPYGSKTWLMTKQVLPEGLYMDIKDLIVARQPFKDGDKNAEIYRKLNEKEASKQRENGKKQ